MDASDPVENYRTIRRELEAFSPKLATKREVVAANKMDVSEAKTHLGKFKRRYRTVDVLEISCTTGDGIEKFKKELLKRVTASRGREKVSRRPVD